MLLEKARAARNRPMWEPEDPNFERPQPQQYQEQEQPQERPMERPDWDRPLERPPPYESRLQRYGNFSRGHPFLKTLAVPSG